MKLSIERKSVKVYPAIKQVIVRFFFKVNERAAHGIERVMSLSEQEVFSTISPILQEYSKKHRNIIKLLNRHSSELPE